MGHQVKLMPAAFVKAFNIRNKNDAADARAIWLAVQQPSKPIAVKTEMQQAMLALHRTREQLVKFRTMQINSLRGLLTEYGEVMGKGRAALDKAIPDVLERVAERLPVALIGTLREQWNGFTKLDEQIAGIERRMREWVKEDPRLLEHLQAYGEVLLKRSLTCVSPADQRPPENRPNSGRQACAATFALIAMQSTEQVWRARRAEGQMRL
jgi:transposase